MDKIGLRRLVSQHLAGNPLETPHDVVSHLGAVQAQDYLGALWAVGLRTRACVERDVEQAIAERRIVRAWPMRGTLHFVAAEDLRWMLELLAPAVLARHRARLEREFDLDAKVIRRSRTVVERALSGGRALARSEIYAALENARIATGASRGLHILFALAHERVLCFGARRGKQPTFVLLDEWLEPTPPKTRDEALAELARRYFVGHAPATVADFAWWSGLSVADAKRAVEMCGPVTEPPAAKTRTAHLLPPYDEFTVAYRDRSVIVEPAFAKGILNSVVVIDGRVAGHWTRTLRGDSVAIDVTPFAPLGTRDARAVERAGERYGAFLQRSVDSSS